MYSGVGVFSTDLTQTALYAAVGPRLAALTERKGYVELIGEVDAIAVQRSIRLILHGDVGDNAIRQQAM